MTPLLHAQQLLDDFNYPPGTTVVPGWVEGGTNNTAAIQTSWNGVDVACRVIGSTVAAADWISRDVSSYFDTHLANNACVLEWGINLRRITSAGTVGFDQGGVQNGMAYVLAGSTLNPETGQGYAVVVGEPGSNSVVRLVRYNGGLDENVNLTTLISGGVIGTHYASIRVTYDPAGDEWELYFDQNTTTGPYVNPTLAANNIGVVVDGTYTGINLNYASCLWNHRNNAAFACEFDNAYVPSSCIPTPPTVQFTTANTTGFEDVLNPAVVGLSIIPAAPTAQTVTVSVMNGPGATYGVGNDYTSVPAVGGGMINVNVPAGQTSANITLNIFNDAGIESTEDVRFEIVNSSAGLQLGANLIHDLRIYDDDTPPTSLGRGDLLIVGINANNLDCTGVTAQDEISFFSFKEIARNTVLDITDCGFEHFVPGLWGENNEGKVRLIRTGPPIPAGTVITIRASGGGMVSAVAPDTDWTSSVHSGFFNLNSTNGDQIFFLQGGNWVNPAGAHNTDYVGGTPVYGFSSDPSNWVPFTQQSFNSGLPPVMDCFSMAPTASTNFTKYTGPTSATDQRAWIIRVGDPTNWTGYPNCAAYNSANPDYLGGHTFALTTVGFTSGVWRGRPGNTDWFDCANWDNAEVPDLTTDVVLDNRALNHCDIDGGNVAACASLTHDITGTNWRLTVNNNSQLDVLGNLQMHKSNTSASGVSQLRVVNGSNLTVSGNVELTGYTTGLANAARLEHSSTGTMHVAGDILIQQGGFLDLHATGSSGGSLTLEGDFVNNHQELAFDERFSTVRFAGSGPQLITGTGTFIERFATLVLDKPTSNLTIDHTIRIANSFEFLNGLAMNLSKLVFDNGSTALGMSDLSFATGPCEKIGAQNFTFPTGKVNFYRPVTISGQTNANASTAFLAEYYLTNPQMLFGNNLSATLDHISACEYWLLERSSGSPNALVTIGWENTTSCGVSLLSDLRIARHDGSVWQDEGAAGLVGNIGSGTLHTAAVVTAFSPFTLASVSNLNPLPVELLHFAATPIDEHVRLEWTTATETNNDHFIVERSSDGLNFEGIEQVNGQGTTTIATNYQTFDITPFSGLSYYRLKQVDFNGTFEYSDLVVVQFDQSSSTHIWVDADHLQIRHDQPMGTRYSIYDPAGRMVSTGTLRNGAADQAQISNLNSGVYTIRIGKTGGFAGRFVR